jgi:hypothetical protein
MSGIQKRIQKGWILAKFTRRLCAERGLIGKSNVGARCWFVGSYISYSTVVRMRLLAALALFLALEVERCWLVSALSLPTRSRHGESLSPTRRGGVEEDALSLSSSRLHLLSLQWSSDKDPSKFSKPTRDLWKWKDAVLGDGRDYFVPRPRTLQALQSYLLRPDDNDENSLLLQECVILSNCARFEVLVFTTAPTTSSVVVEHVTRRLLSQLASSQSRKGFMMTMPLDWPGAIHMNAPLLEKGSSVAQQVCHFWTPLQDAEEIATHLACIAAGLAPRPSRPDRPVVFRPFSSRDAHILLQLKRTLDTFGGSALKHLGKVLRTALEAGKAARDCHRVPELMELRAYGTGDSSFAAEAPLELMERMKVVSGCYRPSCSLCLSSLSPPLLQKCLCCNYTGRHEQGRRACREQICR